MRLPTQRLYANMLLLLNDKFFAQAVGMEHSES
jgi:hypothetical protein